MTGLVAYAAGALGWALLLAGLAAAALALAGRRPAARDVPVLLLGLFFAVLTQYPLPDPATLSCPVPYTEPRLAPLHSLRGLGKHFEALLAGTPKRTLLAGAMNFLLCAALGLALAHQRRLGWRGVLALAALLPLAIELTQLTGTWGLYPCPYRQFDIDDLILNFAGLVCGFALGRGRRRRAGA